MEHQFPEGFKPVNIESYDGTTDPAVWIEDFLLHIHMSHGDDLHAIKYLPLKLKGPARHWLNSLPADSISCWEDLEAAFLDNFQGTYVRPPDADDLSHIIQQPEESARKFWTQFFKEKSNRRLSRCRGPSSFQAQHPRRVASPAPWSGKAEIYGSPHDTHDPLLCGRRQLAGSQ